jgi:hypothetical protein
MKGIASLVLALIFVGAAARAEAPTLEGTYTFDPSISDNVDAAIEAAVSPMNFLIRPIARSRLKKTNPIYRRIVIARNADEIVVMPDDRKPVRSPSDGSTIEWIREDGEKFRVRADWRDSTLSQTFIAEDGQRTNEFSLDAGGAAMQLKVTITSERLNKPMTYKMGFRRSAAH